MNIVLIDKIIAWLDAGAPHKTKGGLGFNMTQFHSGVSGCGWLPLDYEGNTCGTAMCIAGAAIQFSGERPGGQYWRGGKEQAANLLGLDLDVAHQLFTGEEGDEIIINLEYITPPMAATVLRNLKETGEVDWRIVKDQDDD